jgi:hypothetical protein
MSVSVTEGWGRLERPRSILKDNIKMNIKDIGWNGPGLDLFDSEQRPVAKCFESVGSIKEG